MVTDTEHQSNLEHGPKAPVAAARPRLRPRHIGAAWHALVYAPNGNGATRRRGSDAFRLIAAALIVLCCWLVVGANSHLESHVARFLSPSPEGARWLVSTVWAVGSFGVILFLAGASLLSRRRDIIRNVALSGLAAWGVCILLHVLWGQNGDRPPSPQLSGFDLSFP